MSIILKYNSFQNLDNLLRYQNHLLIRKIAQDKKWPLEKLKQFIPKKVDSKTTSHKKKSASKTTNEKDSPNFKVIQKKVVKKKVKKTKPTEKKEKVKKKKIVKSTVNPDSSSEIVNNTKPVVQKKKTKDGVKNTPNSVLQPGEVEVMLIKIEENEYYLDPKTDKVYKKNEIEELVFVGMKEGDNINLDAESAEE